MGNGRNNDLLVLRNYSWFFIIEDYLSDRETSLSFDQTQNNISNRNSFSFKNTEVSVRFDAKRKAFSS